MFHIHVQFQKKGLKRFKQLVLDGRQCAHVAKQPTTVKAVCVKAVCVKAVCVKAVCVKAVCVKAVCVKAVYVKAVCQSGLCQSGVRQSGVCRFRGSPSLPLHAIPIIHGIVTTHGPCNRTNVDDFSVAPFNHMLAKNLAACQHRKRQQHALHST